MARVDFYILAQSRGGASEHFMCRLVARVYGAGEPLWVRVASEAAADELDTRLWTFDDLSFIPHARPGDPVADETPVLIHPSPPAGREFAVVLNLGHDAVPECSTRPEMRVLEVVCADERDAGRQRYAAYKQAGHTLSVHEIDATAGTR